MVGPRTPIDDQDQPRNIALPSDRPDKPHEINLAVLNGTLKTSEKGNYATWNSPSSLSFRKMSIPLIDLSNDNVSELAEQVRDACSVLPLCKH